MANEMDLMQRLAVSRKIMEKTEQIKRGDVINVNPSVQNFEPVNGTYNLPEEFLAEQQAPQPRYSDEVPTQDRILNSKLPDEIKKLMLEHPIEKPSMGVATNTTISNELVEKATRLMNTKANGDLIKENKTRPVQQQTQPTSINANQIKSIVRETMEEVLRENGLLTESSIDSNELFKFRVGEHIFEGKVMKIKKVTK